MSQTTLSKDEFSDDGGEQQVVPRGEIDKTSTRSKPTKLMQFVGVTGLAIAALMLTWFLLGLTGLIPSMIEIFGIPGLRFPAGIAISGLLAASIGFNKF